MLRTMVRHNDTVARLAGDEFALIIYDTDINEAKKITEALLESINKTQVRLTVGHLQLRASVGMSIAPVHGQTVQELIGAADVALYHAKRRRRGHVEVLSTDISQGIMEVFSRGFELRNAIEAGDIVPTFQPITDLRNGKPMAYEVLANMQRGNLFMPASQFIKVAEDLGLVREIDLHVIGKALQLAPKDIELFMNINLTSFYDKNFLTELSLLLRPACLEGRQITIEITERETLTLNDALLNDIQQLRDLGCKIALDDFGQGYSTYNYLRRFRPEYLKIDGSYIEGILEQGDNRTIIEHIHALSTSFGAISIAESIENEAIRDAVLALGIHCGQGYHYGKPAAADKLFPVPGSAAS
jgi:predicted signal transduction protein with EAL and GGDEF domain